MAPNKQLPGFFRGSAHPLCYGYPRYTKGIDIWIQAEHDNVDRLMQTLDQVGFGALGITAEDFLAPGQVIQLGYPPARIDLITSLEGVKVSPCFSSRIRIDIAGVPVNFIDLENLRRHKRASGRHQDLADLENLD